jgi:DNA-binding NtrC family response regulator
LKPAPDSRLRGTYPHLSCSSALAFPSVPSWHTVVCVARVDEALLVFGRQRIDVVLLDYHLLEGNAQDVAKRADLAEVPVVWIPGDPDIIETLIRASHFLLAKPFGIQQVLDMLAKARGLK